MKTFNFDVKNEIYINLFYEKDELNRQLLFFIYIRKYFHLNSKGETLIRMDSRKEFLFEGLINFLTSNNIVFQKIKRSNNVTQLILKNVDSKENLLKLIDISKSIKKIPDFLIFSALFIVDGYVNDPNSKYYHLEFKFSIQESLELFENIKVPEEIEFKRNFKNGVTTIYVKKATYVSDLLKYMNAYEAIMKFEDIRIERDFISLYKKINSIDIYNIQKISNSSFTFNQKIENLMSEDKLKNMPEHFFNIAKLRYENPDLSLADLSTKYNIIYKTNYSKSTIYRWLKTLTKEV